ncbi:MAG: hypothetical protein NUV42_02935, partial [Candidatus Yonathbacteria bacterium]|nr:hypothetical protein [Candidatus Yonathbacteria bacterium]
FKSPLAMEVVLNALHQTSGESNWYAKYILGKSRVWFSLELVSIEGKVRFFLLTRPFFRSVVQNNIYAQYPTIEIFEVADYTSHVPYGQEGSDWSLWGLEFALTKEDPYPIKTYTDYGLDRDPKEEFKIDPMTPMLEMLGSLGKGNQMWIQILVRATKKDNKKAGGLFGKASDWKKDGEKLIEKLRKEYSEQKPKPGQTVAFDRTLTKGQQEEIAAIERSISKLGFDCGIRGIYLAKGDTFDATNIPGLLGAFKQYNSNELNGFKPSNVTGFDFPWEDFQNMRLSKKKATLFNAYVQRSYFHPPYKRKSFVLNSEELATIFHFPGSVAETPTFERIESKKVEPPANLPVG